MTGKHKIFFSHNLSSSKGFTLIETFVAITILVIAVLGPMTILSRALQDIRYIGNTITATYLAQEGVEMMIDDRNQGVPFKTGTCPLYLDRVGAPPSLPGGYSCDSVAGYTPIFTRTINAELIAPNQYKITSSVSFDTGKTTKTVDSYSIIFR